MKTLVRWIVMGVLVGLLPFPQVGSAQDDGAAAASESATPESDVFSGPQPGELLPPLTLRQVLGADAGQETDPVKVANGGPIVLVFVHDINRQSVSMTRILTGYTKTRAEDGLQTGVVFLSDDATAAEAQIKRMEHALTAGIVTGVSVDGREGPGSYGLNRNVMLTILIGKAGKVTANYALIQPSLQVDLPKILKSVVEVAGGEVPNLKDLPGMAGMVRRENQADEELNLRPLLQPVIRRDASAEAVEKAALEVEKQAAQNPRIRKEVARIANTIINAGKLQDYGTPKAQEFLKKWATEFAKSEASPEPPEQSGDSSGTRP
ncbi:MAG: hypothetical protein RLZZ232_3778 [Planctomycetota bacterium]|jgi:hypothetical protein